LNGDDWTFMKHAKFDIVPKEEDFKETINSYLGWKLSSMLKEGW
jgi:N-6 DNA methylase